MGFLKKIARDSETQITASNALDGSSGLAA